MSQLAATSRPPNEKPTVYRGPAALIGGVLVVLFCGFGAIDLIVESGTRDLTGAAILTLVAALAALYGVYPAAFAWSDRLVVRNPFRTIELPWGTVTDLSARLSFIAHTETKRFTVWAIPVSLRERRRAERHKARDLSQAQRAARRGLSPDLFGPGSGRRPADPIASLSFADQAIAEMNSKREAHAVKLKFAAAQAEVERAKAAEAAKARSASGQAAEDQAAEDAPVVEVENVEVAVTVVVGAGVVRWTWASFALLGASVVFLIVALTLHH